MMNTARCVDMARFVAVMRLLPLCLCMLIRPAAAQDTAVRREAPAHIHWQLTVLRDAQQVDSMSGDTAVGQSATVTHRRPASHPVGCEGAQTAPITLSRTVTVSPLGVDADQLIGFAITADEMVEDTEARTIRSDGCSLPPQIRTLSARHPELDVPSGKEASWTLLKKDPALVYRIEAEVKPASAGD